MKKLFSKKILGIILLIIGILLAWSGMIYAANDINNFHISGIIIAIAGYAFVLWGVHIYETAPEK